ncbi:MAG: hypothetical protein EOP46_13885 [Sphingobacteriaceae bacterium]|nr:MAG: hypothetical protein EOP46_13885 [Sphingobacteriaceae bacterium]
MLNIRKFIIAPLLTGALFFNLNTYAQAPVAEPAKPEIPKNWHLLDLKNDGFYGIVVLTPRKKT